MYCTFSLFLFLSKISSSDAFPLSVSCVLAHGQQVAGGAVDGHNSLEYRNHCQPVSYHVVADKATTAVKKGFRARVTTHDAGMHGLIYWFDGKILTTRYYISSFVPPYVHAPFCQFRQSSVCNDIHRPRTTKHKNTRIKESTER